MFWSSHKCTIFLTISIHLLSGSPSSVQWSNYCSHKSCLQDKPPSLFLRLGVSWQGVVANSPWLPVLLQHLSSPMESPIGTVRYESSEGKNEWNMVQIAPKFSSNRTHHSPPKSVNLGYTIVCHFPDPYSKIR